MCGCRYLCVCVCLQGKYTIKSGGVFIDVGIGYWSQCNLF